VVGWDDFTRLVFLDLNGLEEVNKYSCFLSSSLLMIKLISVERMDSAFLVPLLTACSLFRLQLPFKCINFFEKEGQRLLSRSIFGVKVSLILLFKFGNYSAISRVVVVLVTIVTPRLDPLLYLEDLPTFLLTDFLFSIGNVGAPDLLQVLLALEIRHRFFISHFKNINVCIHHCFMPFSIHSLGLT
jgi:hypothetical protein